MKDRKQLLLDERDVKYILEQNRDYIGRKSLFGFDSLIAAIGFFITIFATDFKNHKLSKYILGILAVTYLFWGVYNIYLYYKGKSFNKDILFKQLEDINLMDIHPHSIVLIKDDFNKNPNRYLLYYDPRWDCKLFLNYHTECDDDIKSIKQHIRAELKTDSIRCHFAFEKTHQKYSVTAKRYKYYHHKFYRLTLNSNQTLRQDSFSIEGKEFFWMSIAQMEKDKEIMEKNSDIVKMVKEENI